MKDNRSSLSKVFGRIDVFAIGFGTMVGWTWVMLATTWLTRAGFWGTILAFAIGTLIIMGVGSAYGELASALPLAGGEVVYIYRAMGEKAAWIVGWVMTFAYLGVAAWEGIALATAVNSVLPLGHFLPLWDIAGYTVHLSWAAVGMLGAVIMLLLNFFGARPAAIFQVMGTAAVVLIALLLLFGGVTFGSVDNIGEPFRSVEGFLYVFLMIPSMLIGFDVIPQSAEEMNIPPKDIGKMALVSILFSAVWYIVVILGLALSAPVEIRMSGIIPAADVISYAFKDNAFGFVLIMGGILGILTSWNGFFMGATRLIFAMGRAKMLPQIFGVVHTKYRTPWAATILVGGTCIAAPLLGRNALNWFVDTSTFCSLFAYFCVCLAFLMLRKTEPDLIRPFKVRFGFLLGGLFTFIALIYFVIYIQDSLLHTQDSFDEMILIGIWLFLGIVMALWAKKDFGRIPAEERELLIFGEKLARRSRR